MAKKKAGKKPGKKKSESANDGEPCPACGETKPLFWHGRRVLCESCLERATHEAERGELTMGAVISGAFTLFRETGFVVAALLLVFSVPSSIYLEQLDLDEATWLAVSVGQGVLSLIFVAAAFDYVLTRLDGGEPKLAPSLQRGLTKFLPLFLTLLLQQLIVMVLSVLLVVPGVLRALSYAIVVPLVVSGESGAISALAESHRRMYGHRKALALLLFLVWLPTLVVGYLEIGLMQNPDFVLPRWLELLHMAAPLLDLPWLFVVLTMHAKLRARYRLKVLPQTA